MFNCDNQNSPSWQMRADEAVNILLANQLHLTNGDRQIRIADFGCGNRRLKDTLAAKLSDRFDYYGCDLQPQSPETYQIDLEHETPTRHFDLVFCLGLLEYLRNVENFLTRLSQICDSAIISYVVKDSKSYLPADIQQKQWQHHYSCQELEIKIKAAGFAIADFRFTNQGKTGLWLINSQIKATS